jgi:hypothetical protein
VVTTLPWSTPTLASWSDGLTITGQASGLVGTGSASTVKNSGVGRPAPLSSCLVSGLLRARASGWNGQPVYGRPSHSRTPTA